METNNNLIIADSSALVPLTIKSDHNHVTAVKLVQQIAAHNQTVLIPCDVFAETVNILGKKFGHGNAMAAFAILLAGGVFVIEETGEQTRNLALGIFASLP